MYEEIAKKALNLLSNRRGFDVIDELESEDEEVYNEIVEELAQMFKDEFNKEIF